MAGCEPTHLWGPRDSDSTEVVQSLETWCRDFCFPQACRCLVDSSENLKAVECQQLLSFFLRRFLQPIRTVMTLCALGQIDPYCDQCCCHALLQTILYSEEYWCTLLISEVLLRKVASTWQSWDSWERHETTSVLQNRLLRPSLPSCTGTWRSINFPLTPEQPQTSGIVCNYKNVSYSPCKQWRGTKQEWGSSSLVNPWIVMGLKINEDRSLYNGHQTKFDYVCNHKLFEYIWK